jgi:hypothetical protein
MEERMRKLQGKDDDDEHTLPTETIPRPYSDDADERIPSISTEASTQVAVCSALR